MAKRALIIGGTTTAVLLACVGVVPHVMLSGAEKTLETHCASTEAAAADGAPAPEDAYFGAIRTADMMAAVPWLRNRAETATADAAVRCMQSFSDQCSILRDTAIRDARRALDARAGIGSNDAAPNEQVARVAPSGPVTWQSRIDEQARTSFCQEWDGWISWMAEQDLNTTRACPVCPSAVDAATTAGETSETASNGGQDSSK